MKSDIENITPKYNEIRWTLVDSVIHELNGRTQYNADLVAADIQRIIFDKYPDVLDLKDEFDKLPEDSHKINEILLSLYRGRSSGMFGRSNIVVATDNYILYSRLLGGNSLHMTWDEFVKRNYNKFLVSELYNGVVHNRDSKPFILEPESPTVEAHRVIPVSDDSLLKDIMINEGLNGLYGYRVVFPSYITQYGDIFGVMDYDSFGNKIDNHKLIVLSIISLYDIIKFYHNDTFELINVLEREELKTKTTELSHFYHSSIFILFLHVAAILTIFHISKRMR